MQRCMHSKQGLAYSENFLSKIEQIKVVRRVSIYQLKKKKSIFEGKVSKVMGGIEYRALNVFSSFKILN